MDIIRTTEGVTTCQECDGPMPPPAATGRTRIYCTAACRKAAYEKRRARKPDATRVEVVEVTVRERERHDIRECVEVVKASPVACRNVLLHLIDLHHRDELYAHAQWSRLIMDARVLGAAVAEYQRRSSSGRLGL